MAKSKLYFHSMDAIFRIIAVDPDLPDPNTIKARVWRRPVQPTHPSVYSATFSDLPPFESYRPDIDEEFYRECLVDPRSGQRIYYWRRANG